MGSEETTEILLIRLNKEAPLETDPCLALVSGRIQIGRLKFGLHKKWVKFEAEMRQTR